MRWTDLPLNPSRRMLRQFAGLWVLFFGTLALLHFYRRPEHGHALLLAVLALTVGPLGLIAPAAIRPVFVTWTVLAFPIGWTVSRVLLAALFYVVVTPIGLVFKMTGRDPLGLRRQNGVQTYWRAKPPAVDAASYYRQY